MTWSDCPPWIDPGNAFRVVVKSAAFKANLEYGVLDIPEESHVLWFDVGGGYNLDQFVEEMASKIIWGPSQQLLTWGCDLESGYEWKVTRNDQFITMVQSRSDLKFMHMSCEVVDKDGYNTNASSSHATSAVTHHSEAVGDTGGDADDLAAEEQYAVDWNTLTILPDEKQDGEAACLADEEAVYEAFGLNEEEEAAAGEGVPIPVIPTELQQEMDDIGIPIDDYEPTEPLIDWDRDNPEMEVGIIYPSMEDFRLAIRQYAIVEEFELCTEKSDRTRFRGCCSEEGCPWKIRARTQADSSVRVQIMEEEHKCASRSKVLGKMASQAWVAERAITFLKRKPSIGCTELQKELEHKYNTKIAYQTVWYGKLRASNKLFGKWDDSFDSLYRFKAEIELRAPDSVVEIDTVEIDGKIHFSRFFCAFKACIDGFKSGCRPYISIDSTALNGQWNGHLPAANAIDGHNWMFPIAFGIFDSETKENWTWFMEQLGKALGPMDKLTVCTDACKGLESAVKAVFPWAEQRECMKHLMDNMKKNFRGTVYAKYMWLAARAYIPDKHKYLIEKVTGKSQAIKNWLEEHHKLLWTRSKFSPDIKCDYVNNNLAESWNAWIKEYKDLPVDALADAIREKTVILFEKRRRISRALNGVILPAVIHQLNAASKGLGNLRVTKGDPNQAEVTEIYKDEEIRRHVVYLNQHICSCREWQVSGKPCPHALAVITTERNPNMGKYVDMAFSIERFQAAYAGCVPVITNRTQWPEVDKGFKVYPPIAKPRGLGRQKKNRYLSCLERTGKATRQVRCEGYGELGHRKTSWRCALTGPRKRKRSKKTKSKAGRKKTKTVAPDEAAQAAPSANTPRTRGAAAREAAQLATSSIPSPGPITRRRLSLEGAPTLQAAPTIEATPSTPTMEAPLEVVPAPQPAKKNTPRKKQLATKVKKKASPTKTHE